MVEGCNNRTTPSPSWSRIHADSSEYAVLCFSGPGYIYASQPEASLMESALVRLHIKCTPYRGLVGVRLSRLIWNVELETSTLYCVDFYKLAVLKAHERYLLITQYFQAKLSGVEICIRLIFYETSQSAFPQPQAGFGLLGQDRLRHAHTTEFAGPSANQTRVESYGLSAGQMAIFRLKNLGWADSCDKISGRLGVAPSLPIFSKTSLIGGVLEIFRIALSFVLRESAAHLPNRPYCQRSKIIYYGELLLHSLDTRPGEVVICIPKNILGLGFLVHGNSWWSNSVN